MNINQLRTFVLIAILVSPIQVFAEVKVLDGMWEQGITFVMYNDRTKAYEPWTQPKTSGCYSANALMSISILKPLSNKASYEKQGYACEVAEVAEEGDSINWRLLCKRNGVAYDMRTSVVTTETEVRSSTVTQDSAKGQPLGPEGMKTELLLRRIGNCESANGDRK